MSASNYYTKETDSSNYASGYEIFLGRTNFRERIYDLFEKTLPEGLKKVPGIRVLDIGCGNGKMTRRYLETFKDVDLELHLLEPSEEALESARAILSTCVKKVVAINKTADDYFLTPTEAKYDLIIASYVFYHISPAIVPNIIKSLSKEGTFCVMMGAKTHPLRTLPELRSISKHGDSETLKEMLSLLKDRGAISISLVNTSTDLDLRDLWNNGHFSEEGKRFFSFIYNTEVDDFSGDSIEALNFLLKEIYSNHNGVVHPTHEIIWIKKS
ncbi:MAG: class I SAM-dependent methyltransferase [Bacteriovoracia bacterium]